MDYRTKVLALLGILAAAVLLVLVVIYENGAFFNKPEPTGQTAAQSTTTDITAGTSTAGDGVVHGQVGDNLKGFLNDPTFFDQPVSAIVEAAMDETRRLSILTTSVEKDLRIRVVDMENSVVEGLSTSVRITDENGHSDTYKDLDQDGIIYAGSLTAGKYEVTLLPVSGYMVPLSPTSVRVKDQVEYVAIDDISVLLKTEDDIDALLEDTAVADAEEDRDETEIVKLQAGGAKQKIGIDVSKWQKEIDWEKVAAAGVEFAVIRCGYRGSGSGTLVVDPYFEDNIKGAKKAGLEVGVYFFTQAITEAEAVEEASAALSLIQDYSLELPIYIDTEGAGGSGRADGLGVETRTLVCDAFCRTITNAGYPAGVYASRNWLNHNLEAEKLSRYEIWLAEYRSVPLYEGYYTMWQYSSKGSVDGIQGNVDLDIYYYE